MKTVYIETSIVSYLTSKPSNQVIIAAHQLITREWWNKEAQIYQLAASELVFQEASAGDVQAAQRRLEVLKGITALSISQQAVNLAGVILNNGAVPRKAAEDALHIAIATTNGMDFLLTWNCKHIANAVTRPTIEKICREQGYEPSTICTPEELMNQ